MRLLALMRLLAGLVVLFVFAPVDAAWAHAQLLSTTPAENAVVETAPEQIEFQFNEPVSPLIVTLIGPDGSSRDMADAASGGATISIDMPSDLAIGTHVLSWRVVSADGHPIGGSLVFSIGQITGSVAAGPEGDRLVTMALWASKALLFIALFAGVGGAAFSTLAVLPQQARNTAMLLSIAGVVLAPITLGLQGVDALGLRFTAFTGSSAWSAGFSTSYGATTIAAVLAFALALASLSLPPSGWSRGLGILAAGIAALSLALSGHASTASPQWLTRPAVFLHMAGLLFWVGALMPLWLLLRDRTEAADEALASFSRLIPHAAAPLVLSGLTLATIQMGWPGQQWLTPYGFILAAKLGLLVALFGLALWNRRWLTEPTLSGDVVARYRLRRSIGWEMAIIAIIVLLVAGWRFTPPPRALAEAPAAAAADPVVVHLIDGSTMSMVTVTPGSAGPVTLDTMITDLEHLPMDVQSVSLTLANPALGIEPISRDATWLDGIWRIEDITIPVPGTWQLSVEVRISRFELVRLQGELTIP
jgi:copper transport protein